MTCTSCQKPAGDGLLCQACGAVLPPRPIDVFAALGVPRRHDLDATELETRHRELSRKLHPDRFARAPARDRMLSLQAATTLNDAFRVLKQPLRRVEALLALGGVTITENERLESDLLMEIMELREQLDDAHAAGDAETARAIASDVRTRRDGAQGDIARLFSDAPVELEEIKRRLILIRYFDRLLEAADAEVESLASAAPAGAEGV